MKNVSYIGLF